MLDIIKDLHLTVQNIVAGIAFISQVTDDDDSLKWKIRNGLNEPTITISYNLKFQENVEEKSFRYSNKSVLNSSDLHSNINSIYGSPSCSQNIEESLPRDSDMFIRIENLMESNRAHNSKEINHSAFITENEKQAVEETRLQLAENITGKKDLRISFSSATEAMKEGASEINLKEHNEIPLNNINFNSQETISECTVQLKNKKVSNILNPNLKKNARQDDQLNTLKSYITLSEENNNGDYYSTEEINTLNGKKRYSNNPKLQKERFQKTVIGEFNIIDQYKNLQNINGISQNFIAGKKSSCRENDFESKCANIEDQLPSVSRYHYNQSKQNMYMKDIGKTVYNTVNEEEFNSTMTDYVCYSSEETMSKTNKPMTNNKTHNNEKRYVCRYCGKRFARCDAKKSHERIHTGEKPFSCRYCGKCFSQGNTMKRHERIHTGEKPFSCRYCGKRFSQGATVKTHERVHTGAKPYSCKICGKTFRHLSTLRYHKLLHGE